MSSNIWMQCGAISNLRLLRVEPWRVVEAQHRVSTLKLVDSLQEQELLERLIDAHKPALSPTLDSGKLHYLLFTPFRYPPLRHGSRFGGFHQPGIWYGSESLRTVFAEKAYYRFVFLDGSRARLAPVTVEQTAFKASVQTKRGIDLTRQPFAAHRALISSKVSYEASQRLGAAMRESGVEAFRYTSARDVQQGSNLGVLASTAFAKAQPHGYQTWLCFADLTKVQFVQKNLWQRSPMKFSFARSEFEVEGQIPAPAV